jgi:hypothetical protein
MTDDLFALLLESVRGGGAILRGERAPSRRFEIAIPDSDEEENHSAG